MINLEGYIEEGDYLELVINAIIIHEGWFPANPKTGYKGSRSFRNNNPGNLRTSKFQNGSDGEYAKFETKEKGRAALRWDLTQKAMGETVTGLTGESTIEDLINVYAPASDKNNTEAYIESIENQTGLKRTIKLKDLLLKRDQEIGEKNEEKDEDESLQCHP